jgi:hypothetical protein
VDVLRGTDDTGQVADPLNPENLRPLLAEAESFVEVASTAGAWARAERLGVERWSVLVRPVGAAAGTLAEVPNTDAAFDLLRSWAADDGWWAEAFSWRPAPGS